MKIEVIGNWERDEVKVREACAKINRIADQEATLLVFDDIDDSVLVTERTSI